MLFALVDSGIECLSLAPLHSTPSARQLQSCSFHSTLSKGPLRSRILSLWNDGWAASDVRDTVSGADPAVGNGRHTLKEAGYPWQSPNHACVVIPSGPHTVRGGMYDRHVSLTLACTNDSSVAAITPRSRDENGLFWSVWLSRLILFFNASGLEWKRPQN